MTNIAYQSIEDYVNKAVATYATAISNVESVKCKRLNDKIYIELVHESGTARYFDVSEMDVSMIGIMFGHIISNGNIPMEINDKKTRKEVRRLFR